MAQFLYALTSSNVNRFLKLYQCQYREKICNNTLTKDPTTRQVYKELSFLGHPVLSVCHSTVLVNKLVQVAFEAPFLCLKNYELLTYQVQHFVILRTCFYGFIGKDSFF